MGSSSSSNCEFNSRSLPDDVALTIASFLNVTELCSLGSCSRYLRQICASDCLWFTLFKRRWPSLALDPSQGLRESDSAASLVTLAPAQGWKQLYVKRHKDIASKVSAVINFVEQCSHYDSLEIGDYLKAVGDLGTAGLGFEDVKIFLFITKNNVLLNLVGLHYSMFSLGIPAKDINEALCCGQVSQREVCVFSFRLGRWFFGFRLPDERFSRKVSLGQLTTLDGDQICSILRRGAVHEVLRVQITPAASAAASAVLAQSSPQLHNNG